MSIECEIRTLHEAGTSRAKAARILKISKERLELYIDAIGLDWKKRLRSGSLVIDGVTDSLEGHSKRLGVSVGAIRWRLKRNQPVESQSSHSIVTAEEAEMYADLRKQGMPAWQASEKVGRPYNSLKNACKKLLPDYEQIVSDAPRIRRPAPASNDSELIEPVLEGKIRKLCESGVSKGKAAAMLKVSRERLNVLVATLGLEWKTRSGGGTYVINGIKDSLQGHSERLGVSVGIIRSRLKRQQPITPEAVYKPIDLAEARRFMEHRRNGLPAWQAAEKVGRPYGSLKDACKRLFPDYEEIVVTAPRVRRSSEEIEAAEQKRAA